MTDYSALVQMIYAYYGTWDDTAYDLCHSGSCHPRSYWYKVANQEIAKPSLKSRNAIVKSSQLLGFGVTDGYIDAVRRKNISVSTTLYQRLDAIRSEKSLTWNELIEALLNKAGCDNLGYWRTK